MGKGREISLNQFMIHHGVPRIQMWKREMESAMDRVGHVKYTAEEWKEQFLAWFDSTPWNIGEDA